MRNPSGCPQLCPNCPLKPSGVTAELSELTMLSEAEMREYKYGGNGPALGHMADEHLAGVLRATFTVTESTNPDIEVGDTAEELVSTYGRTHEQIKDRFGECSSPDKPGMLARAVGASATCGGMKSPF